MATIYAKKKPMPSCGFCDYPLIKDYYEVRESDGDVLQFCKKLCIQEYYCPEGGKPSDVFVQIEEKP